MKNMPETRDKTPM